MQLKTLGKVSNFISAFFGNGSTTILQAQAFSNLSKEMQKAVLASNLLGTAQKENMLHAVTFNTATNGTRVAVSGLTLEEANAAISTTALSTAETASTASINLNTMSKVGNTAATTTQITEDTKSLLLKGGLITEEQLQAKATVTVTSAKIADAVAAGTLTSAEGTLLATTLLSTGATNGLSAAFKGLTVTMLASPLFWVAGAGLAIYGIIKAVDFFTESVEEARESAEKSAQEYENLTSELDSLNSELSTTSKRIDELNKKDHLTFVEQDELQKLKDSNDELSRTVKLKQAMADAAKDAAREDALNYLDKKDSYYRYLGYDMSQVESQNAYQGQSINNVVTGDQFELVDQKIEDFEKLIKRQKDLQTEINNFIIENPDKYKKNPTYLNMQNEMRLIDESLQNLRKDLPETIEEFNKFSDVLDPSKDAQYINSINTIIDKFNNLFGKDNPTQGFDEVWNSKEFASSKKELESLAKAGELNPETLSSVNNYNKLLEATDKSAKEVVEDIYALNIQSESLKNLSFPELFANLPTDKLEEYVSLFNSNAIDEKTISSYEELAALMSLTGTSAEDAVKSIKAFAESFTLPSDMISKLQDATDLIDSLQKRKTVKIDTSSLEKIVKLYPEMESSLSDYVVGLKNEQQLIDELKDHYDVDLENYGNYMLLKNQDNLDFANAVGLNSSEVVNQFSKDYGVDIGNHTSYAQKKIAIEQQTLQTISDMWTEYYNAQSMSLTAAGQELEDAVLSGAAANDPAAVALYDRLNKQSKIYEDAVNSLNNIVYKGVEVNFNGISSSGGKDSKTKEFSKELNHIDRLLDLSERRLQKYNNELEAALTVKDKYTAIDKIITESKFQLDQLLKVYEFYSSKASEVLAKIPDAYRDKVANGTIQIEEIKDENLYNLISQYYDLDASVQKTNTDMKDLKNSIEDLKKQKIQIQIDDLERTKTRLEKLQSQYESAISAVTSSVQKEIDEVNDYYDSQIKRIQDQIDAMDEANDRLEIQRRLEKALYDLRRAENQRTNRIYRESQGFVYEADQDAIRDAQQSYDDAIFDKTKFDLQQIIDRLEKERDEQVDYLQEIKDAWSDIADSFERMADIKITDNLFGSGWLDDILNGDTSIFDEMKDNFGNVFAGIFDTDQAIQSLNDLIDSIEHGEISSDNAIATMKAQMAQLGDTTTTQTGIMNDGYNSVWNAAETAKNQSAETYIGWTENLTSFQEETSIVCNNLISQFSAMADALEASATRAEAAAERMANIDIGGGGSKGVTTTKPPIYSGSSSGGPGVKHHTGILSGTNGNPKSEDERVRGLTIISTEPLKPNEVPIIALNDEVSLTREQQEMTLRNFQIAMSPKIALPKIDRSVIKAEKPENTISISIGDITLKDVQSPEKLAVALRSRFAQCMLQETYRK